MGLGDRIGRVVRSNITDWQHQFNNAEKELENTILELQKSVDRAAANQQLLQRQYDAAQARVNQLVQQATLALQQGDENRAREILTQKQTQSKIATDLKNQLDELTPTIETLKSHLSTLKTHRDTIEARAASAKIQTTLDEMAEVDFAEIDAELQWLRSHLDRLSNPIN